MSPTAVGIVLLLTGAVPAGPATTGHGYWIEVQPENAAEAALREALARNAFGGPAASAGALREVAAVHAGSPTAGLAQLAAGLLFLEAEKPADALPCLRHADVARTALADHALLAIGRALEATGDLAGAGASFLVAVDTRPGGPLACTALLGAGEVFGKASLHDKALAALERALNDCPGSKPRVLLAIATLHESRRDLKAAAQAYDRLDDEVPSAPEARDAQRRLALLRSYLTPAPPEVQAARELRRAQALLDAGRWSEAVTAFRVVQRRKPTGDEDALVHVRLGNALVRLGRVREAEKELTAVPADSGHAAEAAYHLARCRARRTGRTDAYEEIATRLAGTPWGEEALVALANDLQKDARSEEALPYYRRLLEGYPDGRYAERAIWRVAWGDIRAARFEPAAQVLERAARLRPSSFATPGFLYWAGRARAEIGQNERARQLFEETLRRYKFTYYGRRAQEVLERLPLAASSPAPVLRGAADDPRWEVPEAQLARVRQLLLAERLDEAKEELETQPQTPRVLGTIAWLDWRRSRLRPAITSMKRAYPEWAGEAGDRLPPEVWRILYPLEYSGLLQQKAAEEDLDPALVAALVCQESTFNPGAVSSAGARGLMQVLPKTGRTLARALKVAYRTQSLYDPAVSLDFGTRYLRDLLDRYDGRLERALAAYNAGPHRVDAWTRDKPEMPAEEFIESIPFTETRTYVMAILGSQEQYRRIYSFPAPAGSATAKTARTPGGGGATANP